MNEKQLEDIFQKACSFFDNGQYIQAREKFIFLLERGYEVVTKFIGDTYYFEKDYSTALTWFEKVGEGELLIDAKLKMAEMYYFGMGAKVDREKSFYLFKSLPEMSTPFREYNLSIAYAEGEVINQDIDLALNYAEQAFDQKLLDGLAQMAFLNRVKGKYIKYFVFKLSFLYHALSEIVRIYILDRRHKFIYIKESI